MGRIIIDQYIPCDTYANSRFISNAFANFKIRECYFGKIQTIRATRFIRKSKARSFSYFVIIRYTIKYDGEFSSYGFIDEESKRRHPKLVTDVENCDKDNRWKIIFNYEEKDNHLCDIYFYEDFKRFYDKKLIYLLNRIDMACKVSFSCKYKTNFFQIYYKENEQDYECGYFANSDVTNWCLIGIEDDARVSFDPIPLQNVWDWSNMNYHNKKGRWTSEARAWTSLSYALNRDGYESLLYSIMGLEAVYTQGDKHIKFQLRNSIPKIINFVSETDINNLYKLRSEFVHGDISYPLYGVDDHDYSKNKFVQISTIALLETIRLLVKNNATKIHYVNGEIVYLRDKTIQEYLNIDKRGKI